MMNLSNKSPFISTALDHPYLTSATITSAGVSAYYGGKAAWMSMSPEMKIKGFVGGTLNVGNEILENNVRGERGSFGEYAYAFGSGAVAANLPIGSVGQGLFAGTSDYVGQAAFDNYIDGTSVGLSILSNAVLSKAFALKGLFNVVGSDLQRYSGEAAFSVLAETPAKIMNFGIKNSLKEKKK